MLTRNDHKNAPKNRPYVYSNWCGIDSLDGHDLVDGEKLEVVWADGSKSKEKISVNSWTSQESDMGSACFVRYSEAFVTVKFRGAKSKVRLVELNVKSAKRIK